MKSLYAGMDRAEIKIDFSWEEDPLGLEKERNK